MTVLVLHTAAAMLDFQSVASRFLLLLLLAPGVGLAGQEAPATPTAQRSAPLERLTPASTGLPGTAERAPLRLSEDALAQEEAASRPSRGVRILAGMGVGTLTALGGGFLGLVAGAGLCAAGVVGSRGEYFSCVGPALGGVLLGVGSGFALGVWWGGEMAGGDGRLLGALAGFGVGAALGFLAMGLTESPGALFIGFPFALIGAVVGYELTQRAPAAASARPRLQPVLAFSQRGALAGLGGSF